MLFKLMISTPYRFLHAYYKMLAYYLFCSQENHCHSVHSKEGNVKIRRICQKLNNHGIIIHSTCIIMHAKKTEGGMKGVEIGVIKL